MGNDNVDYGRHDLPAAVRSRRLQVGDLRMHLLDAGEPGAPLVLLLHGFPEIAYSWRHQLSALAAAGYRVVAPDQRGYGLTTPRVGSYSDDLTPFHMLNLARDMVRLVGTLGYRRVHCVVGHDFGSPVAAWLGVIRPDLFQRVVLMSAPFGGTPDLVRGNPASGRGDGLAQRLAALVPPRKHYQWYYATPQAAADLEHPEQGLACFLRQYYHLKSADYPANRPAPLLDWSAEELARLPRYYVMDADATMPATTGDMCADADPGEPSWFPDTDLDVYVQAYQASGFQGGLNWYRGATDPRAAAELAIFAGRVIEVPVWFIAGSADWGIHQSPGQFERMQSLAVCADFREAHVLAGAGHWVQQEQPAAVNALLIALLAERAPPA